MKWFDNTNPLYPEGSEICRHPFYHTLSFYGPARRSSVFSRPDTTPIITSSPECSCAFCMGHTRDATPDKSRTFLAKDEVMRVPYPKLAVHDDVLFRRQGNLFEIISFDYWQVKYGLKASAEEREIIEGFLSQPETRAYLSDLAQHKYNRMEKNYSPDKLIEVVTPFFCGFHELLTSGRHFMEGAVDKSGLFSSGNCTWQEHRISYEDIILIHRDMLRRNPYISYISTFQNWLKLAGASFEHWHKQILAGDFWPAPLLKEKQFFKRKPDVYSRFAIDTAVQHNFIIAESPYALACLEVGSKSGMIAIISKSKNLRPHEHTVEELHGMSDMVQAVCSCLSSSTPYNEEWLYTPFDAKGFKTPWRVMIRLRGGTEAGFENINQYLVSTISQKELAEVMRSSMASLTTKAPGIEAVYACAEHKKSLRYLE